MYAKIIIERIHLEDVTDYPHCDVKLKNVCLNEVQGSSLNNFTFHVAELDDVWRYIFAVVAMHWSMQYV